MSSSSRRALGVGERGKAESELEKPVPSTYCEYILRPLRYISGLA